MTDLVTVPPLLTAPGAAPAPKSPRLLPVWIVTACILFNFGLCFINTRVTQISPAMIIMCELMLVSAAAVTGFTHAGRDKHYWLGIILLQMALIIVLSIIQEDVLMKPLRDVIIMPVFTVLGLACRRVKFNVPALLISLFVSVIALFEAVFLDTFLSFFNIRRYFIAKGADTEADFHYSNSDLFVSGMRPSGRFLLDIPGLHRVSSVFLEPVSLGFFAFIAALYFIAMKPHMLKRTYYAGLFLAAFLIWISDGRMALGAFAFTLAGRPFFARLDHRFCLLIFPLFFGLMTVLYTANLISIEGEGLGARIAETMNVLRVTDVEVFLGLRHYPPDLAAYAVDSTLLELMNNQGIFGFLLFWLAPLLFRHKLSRAAKIYLFGLSIFFSFGFVISSAVFTIKTAALLWFQFGYIVAVTDEPKDAEATA